MRWSEIHASKFHQGSSTNGAGVAKLGIPLGAGAHAKLYDQVLSDLDASGKIPVAMRHRIMASKKFGVMLYRSLGGTKLHSYERDVSVGLGGCKGDFCIKALKGEYDRDSSIITIYRDASRSYFEPAMKRQLTSYEAIKFTILHELGHVKGAPNDELHADRYARDRFN